MRMVVLGVALGVVCLPLPSLAQTAKEKELAKKRYEVGEQLYDISQYEKARIEFEEAYRLFPLPKLLFNIARCYELTGRPEEAVRYYRMYLDKDPGSAKKDVIEARIKSIEQRRQAGGTTGEAPAGEAPAGEPGAGAGSGWRRITGWTAVAVGGAVLVTGVIFGGLAAQKSGEHDDAKAEGKVYDDLIEIQQAGEGYERAQIGLLVAGGVVAAIGGGLLLWDRMGRREEQAAPAGQALLVPVVSSTGVGLAGSIHF